MRNFLLLFVISLSIFSCKKKENCYIFTIEKQSQYFSPQVGAQVLQTSYTLVEMCEMTNKDAKEYAKDNTRTETVIGNNTNTTTKYIVTYKIKE